MPTERSYEVASPRPARWGTPVPVRRTARPGQLHLLQEMPLPRPLAAPPHRPHPPAPRTVHQHPERLSRKEPTLFVSVSAVLLLGLLVYLLWRYARLPLWQIAVCTLFGYYLATSTVGPHIGRLTAAAVRYLAGLDL